MGFFVLIGLRLWINGFQKPIFNSMDNSVAFIEDPFLKTLNLLYLWILNLKLLLKPSELCFDYSNGCISLIQNLSDPRLFHLAICIFLIVLFIGGSLKILKLKKR